LQDGQTRLEQPMTDAVAEHVERLRTILASVEIPFVPAPGASAAEIAAVEHRVGIEFDDDLRSFWQFANGAFKRQRWFAVQTDELTGCYPVSLPKAVEAWGWFEVHDPARDIERSDEGEPPPRDPRIRPLLLHQRGWFPVAEFNGFSTAVNFDADPSPAGRHGQIIAFQHDPDAITYDGFVDFFRQSNELLAANLTKILFAGDEYKRICHMGGITELVRQLATGLDVTRPNWRGHTLREVAAREQRADVIAYLYAHRL
jgi:cell wall assembly regulator SMI1